MKWIILTYFVMPNPDIQSLQLLTCYYCYVSYRELKHLHVAAVTGHSPGQNFRCLPFLQLDFLHQPSSVDLCSVVSWAQSPQFGRHVTTNQNTASSDVPVDRSLTVQVILGWERQHMLECKWKVYGREVGTFRNVGIIRRTAVQLTRAEATCPAMVKILFSVISWLALSFSERKAREVRGFHVSMHVLRSKQTESLQRAPNTFNVVQH